MELYRAKYSDKKKKGSDKKRFDRKPDNKSRSFRNSRRSDSNFRGDREMFDATCGDCGAECKIPFEPKFNKPVYCSSCFEKNEPRKSKRSSPSRERDYGRRSRDDDYRKPRDDYRSRDDDYRKPRDDHRGSRDRDYGNRNSQDQRDRRPKYDDRPKSKNQKFQKKQDSFFANGSDKFYASLKEKLFEILGGKICSSCGFRDERALGFTHIYDDSAFDQIRRGGFASSWGKFISEPDLARKELRVLCLNCNEIREPQQKKDTEKPKKKSKYFPR